VSGPTARTIVTQRFENPADGFVEGVYVFPLPENSAVDTLKIVAGNRVIVGEVKERQEAKIIYETAKASGQAAALLEQERPNLFTNSVANIGPHETVIVQIEYQETVKQTSGIFSLRLPLVVAPRYMPAPIVQSVDFSNDGYGVTVNDPVPDRERINPPVLDPKKFASVNPTTISVSLNAGFELGEVKSLSCLGATHIPERWDENGKKYKCTADDSAYATFELENGVICHFNSSWSVRVDRDDLLTLQVDGTHGTAVAGLRDCKAQALAATPRCIWNPDIDSPINYKDGWQRVPSNATYDNAFKVQWELFLKHVVKDEPFPWNLLQGAKGVQLAELGLESWAKRKWIDVPKLG